MTGYIIKRILAMIPVLLIVGLFAFSIMHLAKGDPAILLAGGQEATPDYIEKIRGNLGLNRPLLVQLGDWFWGVIRGDFGESYVGRKDVMSLIVPRLLPTLSLAAFTEIFAVVFGIPLGVVAAWKAGSWIDRAVMALSTVGFSAPLFFLGFVLMIIFGVKLEWLPVAGYVAPTQDFSAFISRMVMPTLATGLVVMSWIARMTRATVLETLNEDYIRTARAKGLTENVVLIRHPPDRHRHRHGLRGPAGWCCGSGVGLCYSGTGEAHGERHPKPGPAPDPGSDHAVGGVYLLYEPGGGRSLRLSGPEDQILMAETGTVAFQPSRRFAGALVGASRALRKNPNMAYGLIMLVIVALMAILAPVLFTQDPKALHITARLQEPFGTYWFGTDNLGRDVYSRTIYGSRVSLLVAGSTAAGAMTVGSLLGVLSGYYRKLDLVLMRVVDAMMAIPTILLGMALIAMLGAGSIQNVIFALIVTQAPVAARIVRSSVLELREQAYVEAARAIGASPFRIITRHMIPNALAPMIAQATYIAAVAVLVEASLSFLGAGVPPEVPSWGGMMAAASNYLTVAMWLLIFPGVFLTLTVLAISLTGDGLRDSLDPRLRRIQ